jgi:hypothetical protein
MIIPNEFVFHAPRVPPFRRGRLADGGRGTARRGVPRVPDAAGSRPVAPAEGMIAETLFSAELLRAYSTQKFRDHAAGQPDRWRAGQAGGRIGAH